ncbi:putative retrotransposon nucleocapsid protein, partial [Puccinia sorghi]
LDGLNFSVVPDALSRRDNIYPREGKVFANNNPDNVRTIFSPLIQSNSHKNNYPILKKAFLISQDFSWPGMTRDIKDYVSSCYDFNCNKSLKHRKYGLLQPLPIPPLPWNSLSMDFISQLPLSNGYDTILVVVDCFSKMSLFIRTKTTCTSLELADLFIEHVFSKHGLPENIVSNCGS